jgi:hypothetical protein
MGRKVLSLVGLGVLPAISLAHHSVLGRYDNDDTLELEGRVIDVQWANPHVYFTLEVTMPGGEPVAWSLEGGPIARLERSGIRRDSIQAGDVVRVAGSPPLTEERELFVSNILTPRGEELLLRQGFEQRWSGAARLEGDYSFRMAMQGDSSQPELGLFRVWSTTAYDPWIFPATTDFSDIVSEYPLTEAGIEAFEQYDPLTDNPTRDCTQKGMPQIMGQPLPMEIVRDGSDILVRIEEGDAVRRIHMDQYGAPEDGPGSSLGYSVGRWEGDTLVVTTSNLNWPLVTQIGIPQSQEAVLVERLTAIEDGSVLHYELVITDPVNFTEPLELDKDFLYLPDIQIMPYECALRE